MTENNLLSLIIFAPLAGAVINWLIGGRLRNEMFSGLVACGTIAISFTGENELQRLYEYLTEKK